MVFGERIDVTILDTIYYWRNFHQFLSSEIMRNLRFILNVYFPLAWLGVLSFFLVGWLQLNAQQPLQSVNAAHFYREAFSILEGLNEAEVKLLQNFRFNQYETAENKTPNELRRLRERLKPAIDLTKKASKLNQIDWKQEGENSPWIHLAGPSKQLLKGLVLQASHDIQMERYEEANDLILSGVALSRHIGQDSLFIAKLVESSHFQIIAQFCAREGASFPKSFLQSLQNGLKELPPSTTVKEVLLGERQYSEQVSKQPNNPYPKDMMDGYLEFYNQVVEFGDLPHDQFETKIKELAQTHTENAMVKAILPMLSRMRHQIAVHRTNVALFEYGLSILISGKISHDSFKYVALEGDSFELQSQLTHRGEVVKLRFGR